MTVGRAFCDGTIQAWEIDRKMAFLVRYFFCCSVFIGLVMHLAADGRAIKEGCGVGNAGLSSDAVKVANGRAKVEGLRRLGSGGASLKGDLVGWEMRWVPSGPDPLHHSSSPKKPQTP